MTTPQRITLDTDEGPAEAVKAGPDAPWEIGYPWGDDRFYGTKPQAEARMRERIANEQSASAA